jgi:hypothetical protein
MDLTTFVYVTISVIYALVLAYMFAYNMHLRTRTRTLALKGRQPMSREEGIAIATLENEREGHTGAFWNVKHQEG